MCVCVCVCVCVSVCVGMCTQASFTQGHITQAMISDPGSAPRVLVGEIQEPWEPRDTGYTSQGQPDPPHLPQGYK